MSNNSIALDIIRRERLSDGFLKKDRLTIRLPNGSEITREIFLKPNVVAILPITSTGEVYLTKQPRAGAGLLNVIDIPAGMVEDSETLEAAAERELLEETGCILTQPLISLGKFVGDPACSTSTTYLFLALNVEKVGELNLDDDEYLECFTESLETVYSMLESGEITNVNSIIALERARKYLQH